MLLAPCHFQCLNIEIKRPVFVHVNNVNITRILLSYSILKQTVHLIGVLTCWCMISSNVLNNPDTTHHQNEVLNTDYDTVLYESSKNTFHSDTLCRLQCWKEVICSADARAGDKNSNSLNKKKTHFNCPFLLFSR